MILFNFINQCINCLIKNDTRKNKPTDSKIDYQMPTMGNSQLSNFQYNMLINTSKNYYIIFNFTSKSIL
jgi:hypothetical protein